MAIVDWQIYFQIGVIYCHISEFVLVVSATRIAFSTSSIVDAIVFIGKEAVHNRSESSVSSTFDVERDPEHQAPSTATRNASIRLESFLLSCWNRFGIDTGSSWVDLDAIGVQSDACQFGVGLVSMWSRFGDNTVSICDRFGINEVSVWG